MERAVAEFRAALCVSLEASLPGSSNAVLFFHPQLDWSEMPRWPDIRLGRAIAYFRYSTSREEQYTAKEEQSANGRGCIITDSMEWTQPRLWDISWCRWTVGEIAAFGNSSLALPSNDDPLPRTVSVKTGRLRTKYVASRFVPWICCQRPTCMR